MKYWLGRSCILLSSLNKHRRGTELCINIANNLSLSLIRQRNWIPHISCTLCMCGLHAITLVKEHINLTRCKFDCCKIRARVITNTSIIAYVLCFQKVSRQINILLLFKLITKLSTYFTVHFWLNSKLFTYLIKLGRCILYFFPKGWLNGQR